MPPSGSVLAARATAPNASVVEPMKGVSGMG
jgi:hypothetical protein